MKKLIYLITIPFLIVGCSDDETPFPKVQEIIVFDNASTIDISFANDKVGYIAGAMNYDIMTAEIAKTTDGGLTWKIMPIYIEGKSTNQITSIYAYSTNEVYATIALSSGQSGVYLSEDGGKVWSSIFQFESWIGGHGDIFFKTKDIGFVCVGGAIWKSKDGGKSWFEVYGFGTVGRLKFTSNNIAYAYGGSHANDGNDGAIVKTTDGGDTWTKLTSLSEFITSLSFINDSLGYAFTFKNNIYKTIDGGMSWELVNKVEYGSYFGSVVNGSIKYFSTGSEIFKSGNDFKDYKRIHRGQNDYTHLGLRLSSNLIIFMSANSIIRIQE